MLPWWWWQQLLRQSCSWWCGAPWFGGACQSLDALHSELLECISEPLQSCEGGPSLWCQQGELFCTHQNHSKNWWRTKMASFLAYPSQQKISWRDSATFGLALLRRIVGKPILSRTVPSILLLIWRRKLLPGMTFRPGLVQKVIPGIGFGIAHDKFVCPKNKRSYLAHTIGG